MPRSPSRSAAPTRAVRSVSDTTRLAGHIDATLRSDRAVLTVLGLFAILTAWFYTPAAAASAAGMPVVEHYLPLPVWSAVWAVAGFIMLASVITGRGRVVAVATASAVPLMWAAIYTWGWLLGESPRGYVTATTFLVIALLVTSRFSVLPAPETGGDHAR